MIKNLYFITITVLSIISCFLCVLPIMSVYSGGTEGCTLIVRGYNLMEFSAWGVLPAVVPLLTPAILLIHQSKATQEIELILLIVGNAVSYVHGFIAAREWLAHVGDSMITYHFGVMIFPLVSTFVLILALVSDIFADVSWTK